LAAPVAVRAQGDYLDAYIVKVKPEKIAEFNTIAKSMVDANRRYNGDNWLALETMYGEGGTYSFVSTRQDYADLDKAMESFMGALHKAYGKQGAEKLMRDWGSCLASSRSELRRRRWDLSWKTPSDAAAYAQFIGQSRVLRTIIVHVRSGHSLEFEALLKEIKEASEKTANSNPVFVSQVVEGSKGTTYYVTSLRNALAGFDRNPTMREILGEEGFKKFMQVNADAVTLAESALYRFSPELSNPPEAVASAAADFWLPKTALTARAKPAARECRPSPPPKTRSQHAK
jgi:hypothetical protein